MFAARGRLVPGLEIKYLLAACMFARLRAQRIKYCSVCSTITLQVIVRGGEGGEGAGGQYVLSYNFGQQQVAGKQNSPVSSPPVICNINYSFTLLSLHLVTTS